MNEVQHYVSKRQIDSRTPQLDNEKCVRQAGNYRYDLILIAAERLRELRRQHKHGTRYYSTVDALLDIQEGLVDPVEYLAKVDTKKQTLSR
jgi:DNA-directed RNA polymerase subunit K/omega